MFSLFKQTLHRDNLINIVKIARFESSYSAILKVSPPKHHPYECTLPVTKEAKADPGMFKDNGTIFDAITPCPNLEQVQILTYTPVRRWHNHYGEEKRRKYKENEPMTIPRRFMSTSTSLKRDEQIIEKFILSDIGEGISEVNIKAWLVKVGDRVAEFDPICDVESDKATVTITSRFAGEITKLYCEEGSLAKVGTPLVDIKLDAGSSTSSSSFFRSSSQPATNDILEQSSNNQKNTPTGQPDINLTQSDRYNSSPVTLPSIRRLASELGVDLRQVSPHGRHGRVTKDDVLKFVEQKKANNTKNQEPHKTLNIHTDPSSTKRVLLSSLEQAMFRSTSKSLEIPHFGINEEYDLTELLKMIAFQKKADSLNKTTLTAWLVKFVSLSLLKYPSLNASIDEQDNNYLVIKNYHNISIAVDSPKGLIVPNIKNVERLSIRDINSELDRLKKLALDGKLSISDLSGGTFTISNFGTVGGQMGFPVIIHPELVIGAFGRVSKEPKFVQQPGDNSNEQDLKIEARDIVNVSWFGDHRVLDGATLVRFSTHLKKLIEHPHLAILDTI